MNDAQKLQNILNTIKLKGCEGVRVGDILHYECNYESGKYSGVKALIRILVQSVYPRAYRIERQGDLPSSLVIFSNDCEGRKDHLKAFLNATDMLTNSVRLLPCGRKVNFLGIPALRYLFGWHKKIKSIVPEFGMRMNYLATIFRVYTEFNTVEIMIRRKSWNIDTLLVYCDVLATDSYLVQKFKLMGKKTVTLQHGSFNIKTNAWAYKGSYSDYFLAESQVAVDQAHSVGMRSIMIPVGSPHDFGRAMISTKKSTIEVNVIGVFLNSPMFVDRKENKKMIETVQQYCRNNGKRALIRCHPADDVPIYQDVVDDSVATFCLKNSTMEEFISEIDVGVISASSAFLTLLAARIPAFLFVRQAYDPQLYDYTEMLKFENCQQFEEKCEWIKTAEFGEVLDRIRQKYIVDGDISENYKNAYRKIGMI